MSDKFYERIEKWAIILIFSMLTGFAICLFLYVISLIIGSMTC